MSKGTFCSNSTSLPTSLSNGFYAVDEGGNRVDEGGVRQQECEGGYYGSGGNRYGEADGHPSVGERWRASRLTVATR